MINAENDENKTAIFIQKTEGVRNKGVERVKLVIVIVGKR